jgi:hypothetical protein
VASAPACGGGGIETARNARSGVANGALLKRHLLSRGGGGKIKTKRHGDYDGAALITGGGRHDSERAAGERKMALAAAASSVAARRGMPTAR